MKKILVFAVALVLVVGLIGCTGGTSAPPADDQGSATTGTEAPATTDTGGGFKVAYVARTLSDAFAAWLATEMETAAAAYSDTFTLEVLDSQGDSEKQNTIIETAITQKYDCIIIQPNDGESQRPYAEKVVAAGIFCITTNALIPDVEGASSVDANPYNQGAVLAEAALKDVPQNGKVVILNCLPGNLHTTSRYQAFQDIFVAGRPDAEIIADHIFNEVDSAGAMAFIEDVVQSKGKFDCALTTADVLALAALEAVKDNPDFNDMLAYGVDGLSGALLSIRDGGQTGTCLQNAKELAEKNMKAAYQLLTGEKDIVEDSIGEVYIYKGNIDEWIQNYLEYGLLTEAEVNA